MDREQPAHARAAHRDPPLVHLGPFGDEPREPLEVGDHAGAERSLGLAVAAVVERERREPVGERGAREVGVVLLPRARAVEDDHGRRRARRRAGSHRW